MGERRPMQSSHSLAAAQALFSRRRLSFSPSCSPPDKRKFLPVKGLISACYLLMLRVKFFSQAADNQGLFAIMQGSHG